MGKCSPKHVYKGIQLCKGSQDALDAVVPLELAFEWYEAYIHTCSYEKFFMVAAKKKQKKTQQQQQQQENVQGDSFGTTEDAVPHWPRLDVCRPRRARNMNSRKLLCPRFTGGKIRRPSLWSKGTVSGSVLFSGRTGCVDQADDALLLPLPPCCCRQSHKYTSIQEARGKRFQSFTGQVPRHSTRQPRPSNRSFVTENIETTASVSYHNRCHVKLQHQFRITTGVT